MNCLRSCAGRALAALAAVATLLAPPARAELCTYTQPQALVIAPETVESTIVVPTSGGLLSGLEIRIENLSASEPAGFGVEDFDLLLVPPGGAGIVLMANGCAAEFGSIDLRFSTAGATPIPSADDPPGPTDPTPCVNGTLYRPGDHSEGVYALESPAPAPPYSAALEALEGTDPAGTWRLYAAALGEGSTGSLGSWQLRFEAAGCADNTIYADDFEEGACGWSDAVGLEPACP